MNASAQIPADFGAEAIAAEQALLGSAMIDTAFREAALKHVTAELFYDPLHRRIFDAIAELDGRSEKVSVLTLKLRLAGDPGLRELSRLPNVRPHSGCYLTLLARAAPIRMDDPEPCIAAMRAAKCRRDALAACGVDPHGGFMPARLSLGATDFLAFSAPPRRNLLAPWLQSGSLVMVHAWRGVGKTHFAVGVACAVATGSRFLKWKAEEPARVLYIDGEMPARMMQERFHAVLSAADAQLLDQDFFRIISPDALPEDFAVPNLLTPEGQSAIEPDLADRDVVILDNMATLFRTGEDQNAVGTFIDAQDYILRLRRRGIAVVLIDHDNKTGGNRGSSGKQDVLETVIQLKQPKDYHETQGARFEVIFTKHRGFWGRDALPFEAQLSEGPTGEQVWTIADAEDAMRDRLRDMLRTGMKERDIREELGIGGSKLARLKSDLENRGRENA